jgi:hypothetical protein
MIPKARINARATVWLGFIIITGLICSLSYLAVPQTQPRIRVEKDLTDVPGMNTPSSICSGYDPYLMCVNSTPRVAIDIGSFNQAAWQSR